MGGCVLVTRDEVGNQADTAFAFMVLRVKDAVTQRTTVTHNENSGKGRRWGGNAPPVSHPNEKTRKFFPEEMTLWLKSIGNVRGICRI